MQKGDPNDALQQRLSGSTTGAAEATSVPGQHYVLASQLQQASLAPGLQQPGSGITVARLARPSFSANQPSIGQVLQTYTAQQSAIRPLLRTTQATTVSPSGATIHHMGPGMLRAGVTPFANLQQGILAMQSGLSSQKTIKSPTQTGTVSSRAVQDSKPAIPTKIHSSPGPSPRKKVKLEEKPPATPEIASSRRMILEIKLKEMLDIKENYIEHLTEFFFLQNSGNVMDYHAWKKRPTPQLVHFLKSGNLDSDDEDDSLFVHMQEKKINDEVKVLTSSGSNVPLATPVAISTTLPPSVAALSQGQSFLPQGTVSTATAHSTQTTKITDSKSGDNTSSSYVKQALLSQSSIKKSPPSSPKTKTPVQSTGISSSVYEGMSGISSQEAIVERAKQEAQVMHRVAGLRKEGLWSSRRLPKVQEPPRNKAHWDYLLEEMQWLAADFLQERKWKKAAARKLAKMVQKHFQDLEQKEVRAEKEEAQKLKKIANQLAKSVKEFWSNIEKVVQYKQQSRLDEKRKKALDLHLNFIVDQTEKYSTWLTEGLASSTKGSSVGSKAASPSRLTEGDVEFKPEVEDTDDEETIDKEEEEAGDNDVATKEELEALQKESEMPIEDLLDSLPPEILEKAANITSDAESGDGENIEDQEPSKDKEFDADEQDESDLEDTIAEQEKHEKKTDYPSELQELQEEGEMSFDDLVEKYAGAYDSSFEMPESPSESETDGYEEESEDEQENEEEAEEDEEEVEDEEVDIEGNDDQDVGLEFLMHPEKEELPKKESVAGDETGPGKEIIDIAAEAASLQPKGYTLQTTEVKTPVPFLLKHDLREYQHVGLDWLATMYEKKLNGILADEMGLGKTIQTISLLGHLACEKGIWGPHLIVVPTSVMLNWELELKKWCPAFKILTYYGSQKERKLKRQGWTKTNAFHVCITSYKLVIQDHQSFRRKKWKYLILDEAQNIKNFKSQRWQTLLNFHSQRRLLLTGTPLQNSLMELWSLMHFLMPHVFQSHKEFKEWFANPLTGMIEGSHEYNENLIRRLHKVLRPFLLRRLKDDVEKQMPKKFEHVVMCSLSKRQRYLYDDFMAQAATKETLASGHFMSVINILMQLRKVCNHPCMFDPRPIVSPFKCEGITYYTTSLVLKALQYDPFQHIDIRCLFPGLADMERDLSAFVAHRVKKLQTSRKLIEEIDIQPEPPPRPKSGKLKSLPVLSVPPSLQSDRSSPVSVMRSSSPAPVLAPARVVGVGVQPETLNAPLATHPTSAQVQRMEMKPSPQTTAVMSLSSGLLPSVAQSQSQSITAIFATPATPLSSSGAVNAAQPPIQARVVPQGTPSCTVPAVITSQPITLQIQHTDQGTRLMIPTSQLSQRQGFFQIVQTASGQHLITTSSTGTVTTVAQVVSTASIVNVPTITTLAGSGQTTVTTSVVSQVKTTPSIQLPSIGGVTASQRPVMRVSPLAATTTVQSGSSQPLVSLSFAPAGTSQVVPIASASVVVSSAVTTMSARSSEVSTVSCLTGQRSATLDMVAIAQSVAKKELEEMKAESELFMESLYVKRREERKEKLKFMAHINKKHCSKKPVYGQDLCQAVNIYKIEGHHGTSSSHTNNFWKGVGMIHCHNVHSVKNPHHPDYFWTQTKVLSNLVHTPEQYLNELEDILARYVFAIPAVTVPPIIMHVSHPPPSYLIEEKRREFILRQELSPRAACLHRMSTQMSVQFPELRLIQYDCDLPLLNGGGNNVFGLGTNARERCSNAIIEGKLQTLDILLRRLKSGAHRVLIFTQMTRMLDILEAFLSFHGHRYLRLDGTTRVEQRQLLMERFNTDKRIFCFILSTRSGGIGVNLTGADTVIFYDSDWNPTMDAQAQDRCHRIGQTRDVHIYRLISEKTVEENILKKANQKRMLGDMAIEGGNFTTAFFKEQTIQELFKEPSGLETLVEEKEQEEEEKEKRKSEAQMADSTVMAQFEQALAKTEDETDAVAAENVKAEQKAELAEFDENIPWDEKEAEQKKDDEMSRVELELASLEKELTPIERYAVTYMENEMEPETCEELVLAEEDIETAKKEWELSRLQALKEEDERRAELEEDEMLFTYTRDDAYSQVKKKSEKKRVRRLSLPAPRSNRRSVGRSEPQITDSDWDGVIATSTPRPNVRVVKVVRRKSSVEVKNENPRHLPKQKENNTPKQKVKKGKEDNSSPVKVKIKAGKAKCGRNKVTKSPPKSSEEMAQYAIIGSVGKQTTRKSRKTPVAKKEKRVNEDSCKEKIDVVNVENGSMSAAAQLSSQLFKTNLNQNTFFGEPKFLTDRPNIFEQFQSRAEQSLASPMKSHCDRGNIFEQLSGQLNNVADAQNNPSVAVLTHQQQQKPHSQQQQQFVIVNSAGNVQQLSQQQNVVLVQGLPSGLVLGTPIAVSVAGSPVNLSLARGASPIISVARPGTNIATPKYAKLVRQIPASTKMISPQYITQRLMQGTPIHNPRTPTQVTLVSAAPNYTFLPAAANSGSAKIANIVGSTSICTPQGSTLSPSIVNIQRSRSAVTSISSVRGLSGGIAIPANLLNSTTVNQLNNQLQAFSTRSPSPAKAVSKPHHQQQLLISQPLVRQSGFQQQILTASVGGSHPQTIITQNNPRPQPPQTFTIQQVQSGTQQIANIQIPASQVVNLQQIAGLHRLPNIQQVVAAAPGQTVKFSTATTLATTVQGSNFQAVSNPQILSGQLVGLQQAMKQASVGNQLVVSQQTGIPQIGSTSVGNVQQVTPTTTNSPQIMATNQVNQQQNVASLAASAQKASSLVCVPPVPNIRPKPSNLANPPPDATALQQTLSNVYLSDEDQTQMPTWAPPTPPHDDNDIYIDQTVFFLYEPNVMPESQLPPVYIRKEHKKPKIESITTRKQKQRKEEAHRVPKSLFDRANPALVKLRRDAKFQKLKQGLIKPYRPMPPLPNKPMIDTALDQPEWLIHEDWALLQAVQSLFDVPLNLMIVSPAHLPNWDMVADVVNSCSRVYRSPKQCRLRYENVIIPREEGRIMYDLNPRKQKKTKTKTNRPMKTSQLHSQDSSNGITILYTLRFDSVKGIAIKRPPTMRQTLVNPLLKNPKHASVLQENGISYDHPLNPMQVAEIRAQRIQRERKQNQQAAAEQQQQQQVAAAGVVAGQRAQTAAGQVPAQPTHPQATPQATTVLTTPTSVATIVAQAVTSGTQAQQLAIGSLSSTATVLTVSGSPLTQGAVRPRAPLTVQEITAISQSGQVTAQVSAGQTTTVRAQLQTVGSTGTTTLTAAHLAAAQRITGTTAAGTTVVTGQVQQQLIQAGKSLTPQQLRLLNPILKQQQAAVIQQQQQQQQQQQLRNMPKISLTQEQLRQQQQLGRLKAPVIQGQKVIAQQLVSMAQAQKQTQLKTAVPQFTRPLTAEEIQKLKQQQPHLTQQKVATQVQGQVAVSQQAVTTITHTPTVTASQGQFGTTQIIAPVHQVGQSLATVTGTQPGATLVKTVSAPMGSVTIPVSNVSINVSVPQKQGVGKATLHPQQFRQMQLLQQKKVQQLPQKTTLGQQVGKPVLNAVQIIQQQGGRSFTVQQLQQLMKQQQPGGAIQQIIHTTQPTIIATVTQGQTTPQMVTTRVIGTTAAPSTSHIHTVTGSNQASVTQVSGANVVSITQTPVATLNVTSMSPVQSAVTASIVKPTVVTSVAGETVTAVQIHPITSVTASKLASIPQNIVVQPVQQVQSQIQSQVQTSVPTVGQHVTLAPTAHSVHATTVTLSQTPAATPTSAMMTVTVTPTQSSAHSVAVSHSGSPAQNVNLTPTTTLTQHLTPTTLSTQPVTVSAQTVQQTVAAVLQPTQPQASSEAQTQSQPQQVQMQAQASQQQVSIQQTQQQQQQSKAAPYAMRTRNQPKHQ